MEEKQEEQPTFEMKTVYGDAVSLTICGGDLLPTNFGNLSERMDFIKDIKYKMGDVLLAAYAKCGTHWMSGLIKGLLEDKVDEGQRDSYKEQKLGWLFNAVYEKEAYESAIAPRLIPTHLKPNRIPSEFRQNHGKVVLMLRNPKDVAVSYYHHLKNARVVNNKQTWEEFLTSYRNGMVPFGCYIDYLDAWEMELSDSQSLDIDVFYFEDFKTNGVEAMKKLAKHLEVEKDEKKLEAILNACTLSKLKETEDKRELYPGIQDKEGKSVIFRKGIIGDWKSLFTVAQNERYDSYLQGRMNGNRFTFRYE